MSDQARLAEMLLNAGPPLVAESEEHWSLSVAEALLAAGIIMPNLPCPKLLPGKLGIPCDGQEGHPGGCW